MKTSKRKQLDVLLVNPWIYDFTAYNLWSVPLGIYKAAEYLSRFDVKLHYIDCLNDYTPKKFLTGKYSFEVIETPEPFRGIQRRYKRYGISIDEFRKELSKIGSLELALVGSVMAYWYPGVQQVVEILKSHDRHLPVILGGVYPTLYPDHALNHSGADAILIGKAEGKLDRLIDSFGFRLHQIKQSPTPYFLQGFHHHRYTATTTSKGCPFRCNYCASYLLEGGYLARDLHEVISELLSLQQLGVTDIAFYDDALLYNPDNHFKPLLKEIIKKDLQLRFHTPNGLHARFIDDEVAWLMKRGGFKTLRIGLETINSQRQRATGNKTTTSEFQQAIQSLKKAGFSGQDIGVYLMYGLPGQDLSEVKEGVEYLKGLSVAIKLTEFSPIKGTPAWQELVDQGILSEHTDPLVTNNTTFTLLYSGYDLSQLEALRIEVKEYNRRLSI